MINFKEYEGKLFHMLDKPMPLTPDAEMPCLVRLIQDDSPVGKFARGLHAFDPKRLTPKICTEVINDLSDPNRGSVRYDGFISCQYYHYELIGTFVKEGSKDWALYQMMQGEAVTFFDQPNRILRLVNGYIQDSISDGFWNRKSGNEFLSYASSPGWQIYKEPELKYKVGDYLEVDENGKIVHCYIVPKSEANQEISGLLYDLSTPKRWVGCIYRNKPNTHIIRKLKPSEVQIKIGCLSGTVKDLSYVEDGRFWFIGGKTERCPGGMHAILYDEMLDTQTRELVEGLLEAQEKHND